jgi:hypothetical protein
MPFHLNWNSAVSGVFARSAIGMGITRTGMVVSDEQAYRTIPIERHELRVQKRKRGDGWAKEQGNQKADVSPDGKTHNSEGAEIGAVGKRDTETTGKKERAERLRPDHMGRSDIQVIPARRSKQEYGEVTFMNAHCIFLSVRWRSRENRVQGGVLRKTNRCGRTKPAWLAQNNKHVS